VLTVLCLMKTPFYEGHLHAIEQFVETFEIVTNMRNDLPWLTNSERVAPATLEVVTQELFTNTLKGLSDYLIANIIRYQGQPANGCIPGIIRNLLRV
jgi:hypothetical protein